MIAIKKGVKMPVDCSVCFGRAAIWCRFDKSDRIVVPALPDESFEGRPEWCPLIDVPDIHVGKCSEFPNNSDYSSYVSRQAVKHLDLFTKTYCRDKSVEDDLIFRCDQCYFQLPSGICLVKAMARKLCPDYRDFGCMGDL